MRRYCGGTTQLNNLTSLLSADYAYISQFSSNQVTYLITQYSDLATRFIATQTDAVK